MYSSHSNRRTATRDIIATLIFSQFASSTDDSTSFECILILNFNWHCLMQTFQCTGKIWMRSLIGTTYPNIQARLLDRTTVQHDSYQLSGHGLGELKVYCEVSYPIKRRHGLGQKKQTKNKKNSCPFALYIVLCIRDMTGTIMYCDACQGGGRIFFRILRVPICIEGILWINHACNGA